MKKLTTEIAAEFRAAFETQEVKELFEAIERAADKDSGTFEVVISTENLDRYQEVIKLDGWELDHYIKNPVVLWGHDHKLLQIGKATSVEIKDGKLVAKGKFAGHAHAQEIRRLYDAGIVNATSVGFIAKEYEGNLITKSELLEFSFVSVPANPYALRLAFEKKLSVDDLVTKGFMHVEEKTEEATVPEEQKPVTRGCCDCAAELPLEKQWTRGTSERGVTEIVCEVCFKKSFAMRFDQKAVIDAIGTLKAAVSALEVLAKGEEPEGTETEEEPAAETEEQKALRKFSEDRRIVQQAATIFGDVLAEARRSIEARA
jgi:HK97 family phage prohead protease